jgi:hypothetical protein
MRMSRATIGRSILFGTISLFLLGCWEGEKPAPLTRSGSNKSPAAEEKPAKPGPEKAKPAQQDK